MSTSDSDCSIDWLASDEDDYGPGGSSPGRDDAAPSSSSSSPRGDRPPAGRRRPGGAAPGRTRRNRKDGGGCCCVGPRPWTAAAANQVQGFTCVCKRISVEAEPRRAVGKRTHDATLEERHEEPQQDTENELFSHKCVELQVYVGPLSAILCSLRSGRYSQRLSSFQESVAMDRIQRIMGVLQNPNMGGRFLSIILKIEEMLQSWFPHVRPGLSQRDDGGPAKKQKPPRRASPPPPPPPPPPSSPDSLCCSDSSSSSSRHQRLHASAACSVKTPSGPTPNAPAACHHRHQEATQDAAVSSSTDVRSRRHPGADPHPRPHPGRAALPFKISSPCLERLLKAKDSIIAPRTVADGGWSS